MTPVLCYYAVQTSGLKVAMRIRKMSLLFSSKLHVQGKMRDGRGAVYLQRCSQTPLVHLALGDVWTLTRCGLTFTFLFFFFFFQSASLLLAAAAFTL